MSDAEPLPFYAQAVKDRANVIAVELEDWIDGNFDEEDERGLAVVLLAKATSLYVKILGHERAMEVLADWLREPS